MEYPTGDRKMSLQLTNLPREIRDLIWEHSIVRDTIPIDCAVVEGPGYRRHTGFPCSFSPQLHKAYPLIRDVTWRRTWFLPIYDLKVDIDGGTWMEPKRARMTYQIAAPCTGPKRTHDFEKIAIQLLQVCRTIRDEARALFYKNNVFSFTGQFPISTALAFLQDRPVIALSQLSSIEILLTEDNNMRGTADAHFPPTTRSSDCLVLQHAFHYFTDLCNLLSSPSIHLRRLCLTIESLSSYGDNEPESLPDCLAWEAGKSSSERPWVAAWIDPLLQINSLEVIKLYWISDRPRILRMADTLSLIQHSMLERPVITQVDENRSLQGHELEFGVLLRHCEHLLTTIVFSPKEEHFEWGDCSCEGRPFGLEYFTDEDSEVTRVFYKCGLATWKEHQRSFTGFKSAYTAYCELGSAPALRHAHRSLPACAVHLDGQVYA
ncbi:hypothetical protein SVAN01_03720 [Stagonosporopsis vannaccii]|nr:hypothetical protein SVAN01_03720 [Stagonosporopsis vannaccii]